MKVKNFLGWKVKNNIFTEGPLIGLTVSSIVKRIEEEEVNVLSITSDEFGLIQKSFSFSETKVNKKKEKFLGSLNYAYKNIKGIDVTIDKQKIKDLI